MINELGTERFHIKKTEREIGGSVIDITIGQYEKVSFDPKYLGELIELLQEAKKHFEGQPKSSIIQDWMKRPGIADINKIYCNN